MKALTTTLDQRGISYYILHALLVGCIIGLLTVQENPLFILAGFFLATRLILFSNPKTSFYLIIVSIFFADWLVGLGLIPASFTWFPDVALIVLTLKVVSVSIHRRTFMKTRLDIPLILFVLLGFMSMAVNGTSLFGLFISLRQLLKFSLMALLMIHLRFEERFFRQLMTLLVVLFFIQVPTALVKMVIYGRGEWAIGTYAVFGGGLSTILPLFVISMSLGFYFFEQPRLWYLGFLLYFQLFYFACPKRAYPLFALFLLPFLVLKSGYQNVRRMLRLAPVAGIAVLLIFFVNPDLRAVFDSPKSVLNWATSYEYQKSEEVTSGRMAVIELVFQKLKEKPIRFIFGFGPGTMTEGFEGQHGKLRRELPIYYGWTEFTTMSLEYGFAGTALFLWMLVLLYKANHRLFSGLKDSYWRAVSFGFKGIWVSCLLTYFYGPVFRLDVSAFIFWFLVAALSTMEDRLPRSEKGAVPAEA